MNCPVCVKDVKVTQTGTFYVHKDATEARCDSSGTLAPTSPHVRPDDLFTAPPRVVKAVSDVRPMDAFELEVAGRLREMFFAYTNRTARSTQSRLGPSEAGTPCDRRLAMALMGEKKVNPGGDNWASFVGTWVHQGLADMFEWANAGTGRYVTEVPLTFDSEIMPRGTGDLLDRVLCLFVDHKVMGRWSMDKLRTEGPIPTYFVQVHLYAYAARKAGEKVERVCIVAWPREGSSLDDLYVWSQPYDPTVARDALERLERIQGDIESGAEPWNFDANDDCKFCPWHAPGDSNFTRGCPGR